MENTFRSIKELGSVLFKTGDLLDDMFQKRTSVSYVRYEDAVEVVGETNLRKLISHGIIIDMDGLLTMEIESQQYFEKKLGASESVNIASVQTLISDLSLHIAAYLSCLEADNDREREEYMVKVQHDFRNIVASIQHSIEDLSDKVREKYKYIQDFNLKLLYLKDFQQRGENIKQFIFETEKIIDSNPIFFSSGKTASIELIKSRVKESLHNSAHELLVVGNMIITYINRVEYQSKIVKKIRKLKYYKDKHLLEEKTRILEVLEKSDAVWLESPKPHPTRVSLDFLYNDDASIGALKRVRRKIQHRPTKKVSDFAHIEEEYLTPRQVGFIVYDHDAIFEAFRHQSTDLHTFIMNYPLPPVATEYEDTERRLVLFLQLSCLFPDKLSYGEIIETDEYRYPIIKAIKP